FEVSTEIKMEICDEIEMPDVTILFPWIYGINISLLESKLPSQMKIAGASQIINVDTVVQDLLIYENTSERCSIQKFLMDSKIVSTLSCANPNTYVLNRINNHPSSIYIALHPPRTYAFDFTKSFKTIEVLVVFDPLGQSNQRNFWIDERIHFPETAVTQSKGAEILLNHTLKYLPNLKTLSICRVRGFNWLNLHLIADRLPNLNHLWIIDIWIDGDANSALKELLLKFRNLKTLVNLQTLRIGLINNFIQNWLDTVLRNLMHQYDRPIKVELYLQDEETNTNANIDLFYYDASHKHWFNRERKR
ncbi:hypothetical protein B4U79_19161, partial [Dinothrombium tinctorium]